MAIELTYGRALLLSRACRPTTHPAAFALHLPGRAGTIDVHPATLVVAGSAVVMAIATVANVARHWHTGR